MCVFFRAILKKKKTSQNETTNKPKEMTSFIDLRHLYEHQRNTIQSQKNMNGEKDGKKNSKSIRQVVFGSIKKISHND